MKLLILILIQSYIVINSRETGNENLQNFSNDGIELFISNIKNKVGLIQVGLFDSEVGYPDNPAYSFSLSKDTISSGELRLFIPVKSPGSYGISILDDENMNGKMDYILRIMPKEGFGFSNNPKINGRKPPPFMQTNFKFSGGIKPVSVRMVYL
jgi:uncharacterized protein (DUF2141 family)